MSMDLRARAEELRTKIRTRVETIRGGGSSAGSPLLEGQILTGPLITEIRTKGIVATAQERITKFRGRGRILGEKETTPAGPAAPPTPKPTMYPAAAKAPEKVDMTVKPRLY